MLDNNRSEKTRISLLPWPSEWGGQNVRRQIVVLSAVFVLGFILFIPYSISAAAGGNFLTATFGVVGCLVCLTFLAATVLHWRPRPRYLPPHLSIGNAPGANGGIRLPYGKQWVPILAIWLVVGMALLIVRIAMGVNHLANLDFEGQSGRVAVDVLLLVIAIASLIALASVGIYLLRGRRKSSFFAMNDVGVRIEVRGRFRTLEWDEIKSVDPCIVNNYSTVRIVPKTSSSIRINSGGGRPVGKSQEMILRRSIDVFGIVLEMDPALLLYLVRYYWQHPESRHELAGGAVIERIRLGDLVN